MKGVPGIGDGILKKVKELIEEGTIKRFEFIDKDDKLKTLELLEGVFGVGPVAAQKFYAQGVRTIEQLKKKEASLTSMQKLGLKYYEDFLQKIPRAEVG